MINPASRVDDPPTPTDDRDRKPSGPGGRHPLPHVGVGDRKKQPGSQKALCLERGRSPNPQTPHTPHHRGKGGVPGAPSKALALGALRTMGPTVRKGGKRGPPAAVLSAMPYEPKKSDLTHSKPGTVLCRWEGANLTPPLSPLAQPEPQNIYVIILEFKFSSNAK